MALQVDIQKPWSGWFVRRVKRGLGHGESRADLLFQFLNRVHCSHTPFPSLPGFEKRTSPPGTELISSAPLSPMYVLCLRLRNRLTLGCPSTWRMLSACGGYIRP